MMMAILMVNAEFKQKSRWEFLAVRLLVLVDHGQKSAFRIKQIVESTFLTSENVKYDLERDITCLKWSIWSNWKIILEITLTPHIPACVNQGNWSHQILKTIRLHLPNSLRAKTIQNHTTSPWRSCKVFVPVVVWLLWFHETPVAAITCRQTSGSHDVWSL